MENIYGNNFAIGGLAELNFFHMSKKKLPTEIQAFFAEQGRKGGKMGADARLEKVCPKRRQEIAREAAKARWSKERRDASR